MTMHHRIIKKIKPPKINKIHDKGKDKSGMKMLYHFIVKSASPLTELGVLPKIQIAHQILCLFSYLLTQLLSHLTT